MSVTIIFQFGYPNFTTVQTWLWRLIKARL